MRKLTLIEVWKLTIGARVFDTDGRTWEVTEVIRSCHQVVGALVMNAVNGLGTRSVHYCWNSLPDLYVHVAEEKTAPEQTPIARFTDVLRAEVRRLDVEISRLTPGSMCYARALFNRLQISDTADMLLDGACGA